jgi:hypothetical protein
MVREFGDPHTGSSAAVGVRAKVTCTMRPDARSGDASGGGASVG